MSKRILIVATALTLCAAQASADVPGCANAHYDESIITAYFAGHGDHEVDADFKGAYTIFTTVYRDYSNPNCTDTSSTTSQFLKPNEH